MALKDIKENLARNVHEPTLNICQVLVDCLAAAPPAQLKRLTYLILAKFANCRPDDDAFQAALTVLTTISHNPLTLYFVFYDEEDDREVVVSASEAIQSVNEAVFIHPRTGERVHDFERQLKPVFKASKEFVAALAIENDH